MELDKVSKRLSELAANKPNRYSVEEVDSALQSKHEGIQVCAAKTLGAWGDEKSIEKLKNRLEKISKLPARWGAVSAMSKSLAPHLKQNDIDWVLSLYLNSSNPHNRFSLSVLLMSLPKIETLRKLELKLDQGGVDPKDVRNAKAIIQKSAI
jgi:HEAT repeat protein